MKIFVIYMHLSRSATLSTTVSLEQRSVIQTSHTPLPALHSHGPETQTPEVLFGVPKIRSMHDVVLQHNSDHYSRGQSSKYTRYKFGRTYAGKAPFRIKQYTVCTRQPKMQKLNTGMGYGPSLQKCSKRRVGGRFQYGGNASLSPTAMHRPPTIQRFVFEFLLQ